jgi:hypothetical protein
MAGLRSFREPRTIEEFLRLVDSADGLRGAGRSADTADAALDAARASFDPDSIRISQLLREMERDAARMGPQASSGEFHPNAWPAGTESWAAAPTMFDDMSAANKANNSFQALQSGRTLNLRNQNTPMNQMRRDDILTAAQDSIRGQQQALASENLGRAGAALGAGGLAAMIAESSGRMAEPVAMAPTDMPAVADAMEEPTDRGWMEELQLPDVPIMEPDVVTTDDFPAIKNIARDLEAEQMDLLNDDPMATADLVQESRPLPGSMPTVRNQPGRLTPEEIAMLRSQVVAIRDAQTGQAMDSFYPPESEEYKAEQRAKQMYPQLRRR